MLGWEKPSQWRAAPRSHAAAPGQVTQVAQAPDRSGMMQVRLLCQTGNRVLYMHRKVCSTRWPKLSVERSRRPSHVAWG